MLVFLVLIYRAGLSTEPAMMVQFKKFRKSRYLRNTKYAFTPTPNLPVEEMRPCERLTQQRRKTKRTLNTVHSIYSIYTFNVMEGGFP